MAKKNTAIDQDIQEGLIASWVTQRFNEAQSNKSKRMQLDKACINAYNGDGIIKKNDYSSNHISNFIHATLETIRPIMTDNNPKFQALARTPEGKDMAEKVQLALNYEWDRTHMNTKLPKTLLTALKIGTGIFYLPWDPKKDGIGQVRCIEVNPFNFFPDPMATTMEDTEFVIYATYKNINIVKKLFPDSAEKLTGTSVTHNELVQQEVQIPIANQILILECWTRDYTYIDVEEADGSTKRKRNYPLGRVITVASQQNIVLSDKPNPYKDGKFPFVVVKDYDIPFQFWGNGDVEQLLSPQYSLNELNNAVIDHAKLTANSPWIIDKNAGVPFNSLTNEQGLVIRINPGTNVRREQPASMPNYVPQKIMELKDDMESIAGIHNSTRGQAGDSVVAAQAIMALQEAGQSRIRLKVKIMEEALSELATMWYARMQQFWKKDRIIRVADINGKVTMENLTKSDLDEDFDIIITAGSTMPVNRNAMLDLMIRLGQTPAEDGLPMVDREAIMEFVPISNKQGILERMGARAEGQLQEESDAMEQQLNQMVEIIQALTKEVEGLKAVHEKEAKEKKEQDLVTQGFERGKADQGLTNDEISGIIDSEKKIPDEIMQEIELLTDEELAQLKSVYPDLGKILADNS